MHNVQTTSLAFVAFLAADAFRWEGGLNLPRIAQGAAADAVIFRTYRETLAVAHKVVPFRLMDLTDATRAAITLLGEREEHAPDTIRMVG